jgi:perosamine synthetase
MINIPHSKPWVSERGAEEVSKVVLSGMHAGGQKTQEFEQKFSKVVEAGYAKAVSSGTTALHLSLLALHVAKNDQVIIPSYVCQALYNAVSYTQATPILADINEHPEENGYNISTNSIEQLISPQTKAIIVPHMFGTPTDIKALRKFQIPIIEDCAQALGAKQNNKPVGTQGTIGIFSFYATKVISTGHGGMIVTNSEEIIDKIHDLTQYDQREHLGTAYNYQMTDLQAALGITQLEKLPYFIARRKDIAQRYDHFFNNEFGIECKVASNHIHEGGFPFRYVLSCKDEETRDVAERRFKKNGIGAEKPIYKPGHIYRGFNPALFSNSQRAQDTALSIPLYPALTNDEIDYITR